MKRMLLLCTACLMPLLAFALKPIERSPLATAPTYMDQIGVWQSEGNRVIDTRDGRIQSVSQLNEGPYSGTPEMAAHAFLNQHTDWLGFAPSSDNLRAVRTAESPVGYHVTFEFTLNSVPVYPGNCVVTLDKQNVVQFFFSSIIAVPESTPSVAMMTAQDATTRALNYLQPKAAPKDDALTELVIWAGDNRDFAPCWKVRQYLDDPMGDWEVLVDANNGAIRRVEDRACYINGSGKVFRPDPLTTAEVVYGAAGYTDGNDANTTQLDGQTFVDTLYDITLNAGVYSLNGPAVHLLNFENPAGNPVTATHADSFRFTRDQQGFEDVMCYYHITTSQMWIQSLGFTNIQNNPNDILECDPHGLNGDDNSHYIPGSNRIAFGEGGVDDDEDADVIWHEYGHGIQSSSVPGWGGGEEGAMGEGFGDYWACSHSRALVDYRNEWVFNWDGHNPFWTGRVVNAGMHYPEDLTGSVHTDGQIWSQACYDANVEMGRAAMDEIVLAQHFLIGTNASMLTAAQAILTADQNLNGGANQLAIYNNFVPRGLLVMPPRFEVIAPNGGETWAIDSSVTVQWSIGSIAGNISIELSRNGITGPWTSLSASTPNDGLQTFFAPAPASPTCRVRITSLNTPDSTDMSDADFMIASPLVVLSENFESGAPDWVHDAAAGWTDQWHISTERANSPTHSYKHGDTGTGNYAAHCDARLTSPLILTLPDNAALSFYHQNQSELSSAYPDSAYDGGIIEISVEGEEYTQLTPVGGYPKTFRYLTTGGQPVTGPMPGLPCFAGSITTWTRVEVNLSAYAGQAVQIRFRFGSDNGGQLEGWYVDDVIVAGAATLTAPQDVTLYRNGDSMVLRWAEDSNPLYQVYSSTSPDGPFDTLIGSTDQNLFVIPGGIADVPMFYVVVGWDGN